jgi:hypothetical protein
MCRTTNAVKKIKRIKKIRGRFNEANKNKVAVMNQSTTIIQQETP